MTFDFVWKTGNGLEGWNREWGNGMMEYWNVGELSGPPITPVFHCSITAIPIPIFFLWRRA